MQQAVYDRLVSIYYRKHVSMRNISFKTMERSIAAKNMNPNIIRTVHNKPHPSSFTSLNDIHLYLAN
jgi:hypothetical protein